MQVCFPNTGNLQVSATGQSQTRDREPSQVLRWAFPVWCAPTCHGEDGHRDGRRSGDVGDGRQFVLAVAIPFGDLVLDDPDECEAVGLGGLLPGLERLLASFGPCAPARPSGMLPSRHERGMPRPLPGAPLPSAVHLATSGTPAPSRWGYESAQTPQSERPRLPKPTASAGLVLMGCGAPCLLKREIGRLGQVVCGNRTEV